MVLLKSPYFINWPVAYCELFRLASEKLANITANIEKKETSP